MKPLIELTLAAAGAYLALGALFAAAFHALALRWLDAAAAGAGLGFRLLITPGVIALWPLLALQWHRSGNRPCLGEPELPVSPRRLRSLHGLAWKALAVAVPLLFAAALWRRPAEVHASRLTTQRPAPKVPPLPR